MKATITDPMKGTKHNVSKVRDKELMHSYKLIVFDGESFLNPVDLRLYMGRSRNASLVEALVWVYADNVSVIGHGSAKGGGYDKASAALSSALSDCGITLSERIHGVGRTAILAALHAIGQELFPELPSTVIEAYA